MTATLFPELRGTDRITETCGKCGGTGLYNAHTPYRDNIGRPYCFECGGTGTHSILVSSARARARRAEKAAENAAAAAAAAAAFWTPAVTALRDQATEAHIALRAGDPLRYTLGVALEALENLDPTAAADVETALTAIADRAAAAKPVPTGRVQITGEVLSVKWVDGYQSWSPQVLKMLVAGDGWKVWGTVPESLWDGIDAGSDEMVGKAVEFTATVKPSDDDASFGIFTRPTKAVWA